MDTLDHLERFGYAIVPDLLPAATCDLLAGELDRIEASRHGDPYASGAGQHVIYAIDALCPDLFRPLIEHEAVLPFARALLDEPFILSCFAASRSGSEGGDRAHTDGRVPMHGIETHLSVMFCLDEFREDNGALRVWPGSNRSGLNPPEGVVSWDVPGGVSAAAPQGAAIFFTGNTWHEVGVNRTGARRWGALVTYTRWWVKPTYDYTRCEFVSLTPSQQVLYGFTSLPPVPGEGRHLTLTAPTAHAGQTSIETAGTVT